MKQELKQVPCAKLTLKSSGVCYGPNNVDVSILVETDENHSTFKILKNMCPFVRRINNKHSCSWDWDECPFSPV
jgi:hypothetical protein